MSETPERRFEHWRRTGDTRALADVFDELAPRLLRLAIHLVGDVSTAEDLVQTTFVSAIESAANWDRQRLLEPWLTGILDHRARNVLKVRRDRPASDPVVLVDDDTPLARAISDEHSRELAKALDELQEPLRSAMILSALHGLKPAAIAHALDRSPGAVRVQLHRAREILRKSLPVGIAGALALMAEPARGLDAIRNEVLSTATKLVPSAGVAGAVIGGGLLMKKVAIAVAVLLAGLALFLVVTREPAQPEPAVIAREVAPPEPAPTVDTAAVTAPSTPSAEPRRAVPIQAMPHRLLGRVREFPGETPVAGATVELHPVVQRTQAEFDALWALRCQPMTDGSVQPFTTFGDDSRNNMLQRAGIETVPDYAQPSPGAAPLSSVTTDAEGRFELPSPELSGVLVVRAPGFGERLHPWIERRDEPESERDVYVTRSGRLTARLIDESGAPYEHRVRFTLHGHVRFVLGVPVPGQKSEIHGGMWDVETDEKGVLTTDVPAHVVFVRSQDPAVGVRGYGWASKDAGGCFRRPWLSPGGETKECVIVVRPTCVLSVKDASTGAPIERFHLATKRATGSSLMWSTWNGWFAAKNGLKCITPEMEHVQDLPTHIAQDGPWSCKVWALGYAPVDFKVADPWQAQVVEVTLEPQAGAQLTGRVTRGTRPAPEVPIVMVEYFSDRWEVPSDDPNRIWTPTAGARTDADGRFQIELLPGRHLALIGEGPERLAMPVVVPTADWNVDLEQTARLRIRLVLPDGPAADRPILVKRPDGGRIEGQSDARGEFVVLATCVGEHTVSSSATQSLDQRKWDVEGKVEARAGVETVLELALTADVPFFGRLVVPGTAVLEGWKAHVRGWSDTLTAIEPTGRIPIDLRKAGSLVFTGPDGFELIVTVPKDARDGHEFKIDVGSIGYEGVLTSAADGKPIPRVQVLASLREPRGKGMHTTTTDKAGRFRLVGLEVAPYRIVFDTPAGGLNPVDNMIVLPEALPSDPVQRLDLALPTRQGAGYLGAETIQLVGRLAWADQDEEGVQAQFSSEIALPGALVHLVQTVVLPADGRYDVRLARGNKYSGWFWQPRTGAKQSVSWPGTGADVEKHDVDVP